LRARGVNSSALKSNPEAAIKAVAELQAQIAAQEVKLASTHGYLTDSALDFKQAQTEVSALRAQFAKCPVNVKSLSDCGSELDFWVLCDPVFSLVFVKFSLVFIKLLQ
jgi:hypothetical protein